MSVYRKDRVNIFTLAGPANWLPCVSNRISSIIVASEKRQIREFSTEFKKNIESLGLGLVGLGMSPSEVSRTGQQMNWIFEFDRKTETARCICTRKSRSEIEMSSILRRN